MTIAYLLFWLSIFCLVHSYLLYPALLWFWSRGLEAPENYFSDGEDWPQVSVVMAAYNEEQVIKEKMESLLNLNYPVEKLHFYVGSDCSSDATNPILDAFAKKERRLNFFPFTERRGKPGVVNELTEQAYAKWGKQANHIFLMTDASVMLEENTLKKLIRHFKDPELVLVDSNMLGTNLKTPGISRSENSYVSNEVRIKNREGKLWGAMIGPFGGCFALRSDYFHQVPPNFLVDDFYIAFKALVKGGKAINDLDARCYEAISHDIKEEYRRKARISAGNFQNLNTFSFVLKRPFSPLGFAFLSHKVLRWLGPFFILISLAIALFFALKGMTFFKLVVLGYAGLLLLIPLLDRLLLKLGIHILPLRHIRYFVAMNQALLAGFFRYLSGVKKGTWEPTKRG